MRFFPITTWKKLLGVLVGTGCLFTLMLGGVALARSLQAPAPEAVPTQISYQGYLADESENPIDGNRTITFRLYAAASGGSPLWEEQQTVAVENGYFSVMLGEVVPFEPTDFDGSTRYLGVEVTGSSEMTPRQPIVSVPYALSATQAVTASVAMRTLSAAPGYDKVLVVSAQGGDYTSINAALAAIPSGGGENNRWLVWVGPGVYDETINIEGDVHVMGAGRRFTTIRGTTTCTWGQPPVSATVVMSGSARLSGVAVRNMNSSGCGAAVLVKNADTRTVIQDARLTGYQYTVYLQGGNDGPVIEEVMAVGGGITATLFYMDAGQPHMRDIIGYTQPEGVQYGYGIYAMNNSVPDVRDVNLRINATDAAYGIYNHDSRMWVRHSKISAHEATENVGLYNVGSAATFRAYETMVKSDGAGVENESGWFWIQGGVYDAATFGIRNSGGELTAVGSSVMTERAGGQTYAAVNWSEPSTLTLRGGTYSAVGGSEAYGVMNYAQDGVVAVEGATVTAENASSWNWACANDLNSGNVYVRRSTLISRGGGPASAAIFNDYGGTFRVDSSQLLGDHYALRNASGTVYLAMTLADDGIDNLLGGTIDCLNVYDASNQPVTCP